MCHSCECLVRLVVLVTCVSVTGWLVVLVTCVSVTGWLVVLVTCVSDRLVGWLYL